MKNQRNLGIDLLRAVSMLMVIILHLLSNGGILSGSEQGSVKYYVLSLVQILLYCAVNLYGITSGYVMCSGRFRLSRIVKLWITAVFWGVVVSGVYCMWKPETRSITELISACLPLLRGRYWFFTACFVVYMVSPALNHVINTLPKRTFKLLLIVLFAIFGVIPVGALGNDVLRISGGHHMVWMVVLYLLGGYIKIHFDPKEASAEIKPIVWLGWYFLLGIVHLIIKIAIEYADVKLFGVASHGDLFLSYLSPLIVGEAVCLFMCFKKALIGLQPDGVLAKLIGFVTPGVFSVYLIHVHPLIFWGEIVGHFAYWGAWPLVQIISIVFGTAATIFVTCVILDAVRQRIFKLLKIDMMLECISDRLEKTVRSSIKG